MAHVKKILCPVDYSAPSLSALNLAVSWSQTSGAELQVLHVVPEYAPAAVDLGQGVPSELLHEEDRRIAAETELQKFVAERVPDGIDFKVEIRVGFTDREIVVSAQENDVDLLVISTHGHTGWRHMVFGSIAEAVIRTAPCPVLTIGPNSQPPEDVLRKPAHSGGRG